MQRILTRRPRALTRGRTRAEEERHYDGTHACEVQVLARARHRGNEMRLGVVCCAFSLWRGLDSQTEGQTEEGLSNAWHLENVEYRPFWVARAPN